MKTKHWLTLFVSASLVVTGVFAASAPTATSPQPQATVDDARPSDVRTSVQLLVMQIQKKLQALGGAQPTAAGFADELAQFDKIIADNPGANANDLSQVVLMKSGFYLEVLNDFDKAEELVRRVKTEYPKSEAASHVDEMLKQLADYRVQEGEYRAKQAAMQTIKAALQPGKDFPDFSVTSVNGKALSVSQFKGKVVLVDFWATWCPPCVEEMPHLKAAYQKYHDKGFEIIGISLDRDKADLLKFVETNKIAWSQYFDGDKPESSIAEKYGVGPIPSTYLIGADGKIVASDLRGDDLEKQLAQLLK